jgi:hypothetical protein
MTANIQVSYRDQHGRIFVIGGNDPDSFFDNLAGVFGTGDQAKRVFEDFQLIVDPPVAAAVNNAASLRTGSAPAPAVASAPGAPSCAHGPRKYKESFTSKAGKDMPSSWQCQSRDRNDQCKAQWNDN